MEVVFELTCCKFPEASFLPKHWLENKNALIAYLERAHSGVKGIVKDKYGETYTLLNLYLP